MNKISKSVCDSYIKTLYEHTDAMYNLVKESNPDYEKSGKESEQYKRMSAAWWHGHEINKYLMALQYNINKQETNG